MRYVKVCKRCTEYRYAMKDSLNHWTKESGIETPKVDERENIIQGPDAGYKQHGVCSDDSCPFISEQTLSMTKPKRKSRQP